MIRNLSVPRKFFKPEVYSSENYLYVESKIWTLYDFFLLIDSFMRPIIRQASVTNPTLTKFDG